MKLILLILSCINCTILFGQNIEFYGGVNNNVFHDNLQDVGHFQSTYKSGSGYSFGIAIDNIKIDSTIFRFTLQFDKYKGSIDVSDGGLAGGVMTKAEIDKSIISLGLFPINLQILKRIDLNFGFEVSRLISESYKGTNSGWSMKQHSWSYNLQERYNRFSTLIYFGLCVRLAYDLHIKESIIISPQYLFYYGISNEFIEFPEGTKSMRNFLGIGIEKKLR